MTVSRVINGESNVRDSTRSKVESSIDKLGYAPNEAARVLAGARHVQLAMLYCKPSAYISDFLFGGMDRARKNNAQIVAEKCEDDHDAVKAVKRLQLGGIDGVILPPPLGDSNRLLDVLEASDTPTVVVSARPLRDNLSAVSIDEYKAAQAMTRHIISLGHQRIGFIKGDPHQYASEYRLAGYRDAIRAAGLDDAPELQVPGLFTYRSGLEAADLLLDLDVVPTAIFASNDVMAAATIAVAHRRGLSVPGDLSVCGFDDTAIAVMIWPELTTIHQPIADLSRAATDLLVKKVRARQSGSKAKSRHLLLDYSFVRRQSDAAPKARPKGTPAKGRKNS
jgi:LacI family transcriptional regulator